MSNLAKLRLNLDSAKEYLRRQEMIRDDYLRSLGAEYLLTNIEAGKGDVAAAQKALDEELESHELATCGNCGEEKLVTEGMFPDPHDFICNKCMEDDE